jgi:hypothetical protein
MAIQFDVDAALAKLSALVSAHGAQAVETAIHVQQIDSINSLTGILGWGTMVGFFLWGARWCRKRLDDVNDYDGDAWGIATGMCFVAAGGFMIPTLVSLLNVWAWIGLFNPKLALAHTILEKIL